MKQEPSEQAKENANHYCHSWLFTNKPSAKPVDGGTPKQRHRAVVARHAVEAHQEAKRIEREEEWQI